MTAIIIHLCAPSPPAGGDVRSIINKVLFSILIRCYDELDVHYGTRDWLTSIAVEWIPAPNPNLEITFSPGENFDYDEISDRVTKTFEKHWDVLIKEIYSRIDQKKLLKRRKVLTEFNNLFRREWIYDITSWENNIIKTKNHCHEKRLL